MMQKLIFTGLIVLSLVFSTHATSASTSNAQTESALAVSDITIPHNIIFQQVAGGLTEPISITNANDGSGRLFINEKAGYIRILKNGSLLSTPFLDIHTLVSSLGERGLLTLAFHPNYGANRQFYIVYDNLNGYLVLARYLRSTGNADQADPASANILLTISKNNTNHNGGTLSFGVDGYLYWSTGDGGGAGDLDNNAQNLNSLLGKILRIDVDSGSPYAIPASNPFYNDPNPSVREEIWAYGLRNPWRFAFDRLTHDLYIADVGQGSREEIDFQPAASSGGENYGWRVMEGSLCYNPPTGCNTAGKILPVTEYDHSLGCSVTGGYVYRGTKYPELQGVYLYADFCSGRIFGLYKNASNNWISSQIIQAPFSISTFGEDEAGELYVGDYTNGRVHLLVFPTVVFNSVLPTSRSIPVNNTATIFNSVINAGQFTANDVTLSISPTVSGTFAYQQTNCSTNAIIGSTNPVLSIPAGGVACYILFFTPTATFSATSLQIKVNSSNAPVTALLPGINTWLVRATNSAGPDIIALTTTTDLHQVACNGTAAFAVALSNVGAAATGDITVSANTGSVTLPVSISIMETDPGTGTIIGDHVLQNVLAGENRSVGVFVTFNGCISFDPSTHRIFVEFRDASNNIVGSTSSAVSTNR